jgi:hypothetical protein
MFTISTRPVIKEGSLSEQLVANRIVTDEKILPREDVVPRLRSHVIQYSPNLKRVPTALAIPFQDEVAHHFFVFEAQGRSPQPGHQRERILPVLKRTR